MHKLEMCQNLKLSESIWRWSCTELWGICLAYTKPFISVTLNKCIHWFTHVGGHDDWFSKPVCYLSPTKDDIYIYINRDFGVPGFSSRFFSMIVNNIFYWLTLLATTALAATDHYKTRKVGAANTPDHSIYFGKSWQHGWNDDIESVSYP